MTAPLDPGIVELAAPEGDLVARVATHAGMVVCSLRHRGEELLGIGGGLEAYLSRGAVFGIPLLYPWANRLGGWSYEVLGRRVELDPRSPLLHGEEHCLPIHGALAASSHWTVTARAAGELVAALDFAAHSDLLAVFPFPHRLELGVRLHAGGLDIVTTVIAGEGSAVPLAFGFHPYFAPPGAAREQWRVELPARTQLVLDHRGLPTGAEVECEPETFTLGDRTFDDSYAVPGSPSRFAVTGGGRRLEVELRSGYPYAQVFAPPDQPVICFEPMTAPVDALRSHQGLRSIGPGGRAEATFTVTVEDRRAPQ
jgi:aldose 1-epimerase